MTALTAISLPVCPKCQAEFAPKRRNQVYCGRECQRASSRNASRGSRSVENAERSRLHYERAKWLSHDLYRQPVDRRLGFMADVIEAARERDGQLRGILTDSSLLGAEPSRDGRKNIAKAADAYCRKFWGQGVCEVIFKRCAEPPTGEIGADGSTCPPKSALRTCNGEPSRRSRQRETQPPLGRICTGFRWLTVGRKEVAMLRRRGGCPGKVPVSVKA